MLVVFLLLSCLSLLCSGERTLRNKYVTTSLNAKWQQTALHLEAGEYLRDECPEYFWEFVEHGCAANIGQEGSDKTRYDSLMDLVGTHFLSSSQRPLLGLALALRLYSPRVEADQQMASSVALPAACRSSDAFAVLGADRVVCSPNQLNDELLKLVGTSEATRLRLFPADRHYRTDAPAEAVTTVLYGEIGSQSFCQMHEAVKKLAQAGRVDYVMRHYSKTRPESRVRLSGYAVELAIKSTEYKAQDDTKVAEDDQQGQKSSEADDEVEGFVFSKLRELHPELSADLNAFQRHLVASSADMAPLKVWQLQELSLQAAKRVTQAGPDEALKLMTSLSQNFPSFARSLIRTKVEKALKSEIKSNYNSIYHTLNLDNGDAALFINGMMFDIDSTDIYSMFDYIREEDNVINGMAQLGIPRDSFLNLLRLELGGSKEDRFAVDFRDSAVHWLNDIERDKQYSRFPSSLMELLRPAYPGMLRTVRHNMYHVVMIMDPSLAESAHLLNMLMSLYGEQMPITFGVVWLVIEDEDVTGLQDAGVAMIEAFNYIMQHGQKPNPGIRGVQFIAELLGKVDPGGRASAPDVHSSFGTLFPDAVEADVFGQMSEYDIGRTLAANYVRRLGLSAPPQVLFNGVPLASSALSAGNMEETLLQELMQSLQAFTKAVYRQELADGEDVAEWIVSQPNVMPRLNERVLKEGPVKLDFTASAGGSDHPTAAEFSRMTSRDMSASIGSRLNYVKRPGAARLRTLSYWVIADLETTSGRRLLRDVLIQMKASRDIRAAFVANPASRAPDLNPTNVRALAAGRLLPSDELLTYLLALTDQQSQPEQVISESSHALLAAAIESPAAVDALHVDATYAARVLHMAPSARGLVVNGRLVGPFEPQETFSEDDLTLLEKYTMSGSVDTLQRTFVKHMKHDDSDLDELSDVFMKLSGLLKSRKHHKSRWNLPKLQDAHSVLRLPARDPTRPSFDLVAVCDPISRGAQKLGPLLSVLQQALNVDVKIVLNAKDKHSDMPLKSYYRLVLEAEPRFDPDGRLTGPSARFSGIPGEPILTQHYHVPDNWIVEAVESPHDLDNIKLDDVEHGVHSDFELEHLLVEGHCFEQSSGSPPRGLQITLSPLTAAAQLSEEDDQLVDTIVMANLGYFQLKANPGAWALQLRPGRSQEIYKMVSLDGVDLQSGTSVAAGSDGAVAARGMASVVVNSFTSNVLKLRVAKKPDKQHLDLLSDETTDTASGIWNSLKSTFGSSAPATDDEDDTLNIFSLASGHLYERLMRIMMLSVLKHTSTPVKFWFLKNYLSPTFKNLLEPMSREFGFRYELVQYNWPRWLHQQTEKQRIIWGYKILFLDVLFPLSLKKFIFVDADQIVRADLKELRDLDLEGAPYAYTPFCDSRTEMDGFRFWNQGYWRSHLQGRKYHISALYVVDLKKFRQIAAGDRLRGQYQGLSQDPNSLSNLDQDLPNNMIHQVRIKSLPQEWLWCETWCDDASKATAKTIDLCNNPLTKEAKLSAAARIAPEWVDYDNTIRDFLARVKANSSAAKTADVGSSSAGASHEEL